MTETVSGSLNYRYHQGKKGNGEWGNGYGGEKRLNQEENGAGRKELGGVVIMVRMGNANKLL